MSKKWKILFIKDEKSMFDAQSKSLETLFSEVNTVSGREEALKQFNKRRYDIVIADLSVHPEELAFMKQLQDIKPTQCIFVLVSPKDTNKLYGIADLGIHAFELEPSQLDEALEVIAQFDPYEKNI